MMNNKIKEGGKLKKYKNKINLIVHRKKVHDQDLNLKQSKTSKDIPKS